MNKAKNIRKYSQKLHQFDEEIDKILHSESTLEESELWDQLTGEIRRKISEEIREKYPHISGKFEENISGELEQLANFVEELKRIKGQKIEIEGIELERITRALEVLTFYHNVKENQPVDVGEECLNICFYIDTYHCFPPGLMGKLKECKNQLKRAIPRLIDKNKKMENHVKNILESSHQIATIIPKIEEFNQVILATENEINELIQFLKELNYDIYDPNRNFEIF